MLYLLMLLPLFLAQLIIRSPSDLSGQPIDSRIAEFGLQAYYPLVGQVEFLSDSPRCSFPTLNLNNLIALLFIDETCNTSVIVSAQSMGAIGMILVLPTDDLSTLTEDSQGNEDNIFITVIAIKSSDGNILKPYKNSDIWVTYHYNLVKSTSPVVIFYMSGNYTLDKEYGNNLKLAYEDLGTSIFSFSLGIGYVSTKEDSNNSDCIENMCIQGNEVVNGASMLENSFILYDFFLSFASTDYSKFFSFLSAVYSTCEFNYSNSCIYSLTSSYNQSYSFSNPLNSYTIDTILAPFYLINSVWVFWPSLLETSICLSTETPSADCTTCSSSCSFSDFYSIICNSACNTSSCGYQNLTCINDNGCFQFMLPDDPNCISDSNGLSTSGIIAISVVIPIFVIAL